MCTSVDAEGVNAELTAKVQASPAFHAFEAWLQRHGCVFPNVEFPVAFWNEGIVGVKARSDIPPNSPVVLVPYTLTLNVPRALDSPLGPLFEAYPDWFSGHSEARDYIFWSYMLYERLKGEQSFWHPYFRVLPPVCLLSDWARADLTELQDAVLIYDCGKVKRQFTRTWESLAIVFLENPLFFPGCVKQMRSDFEWVWKVSTSRSFAWEGGLLAPMADTLNHGLSSLDHQSWTPDDISEHKPEPATALPPTYFNRLDKYLQEGRDQTALENLGAVWEIEPLLTDFESDPDEESLRCYGDCDSDTGYEDSEEKQPLKSWNQLQQEYFALVTGDTVGFAAGEQVCMSYGPLSNRELLLDYGFAMDNNPYDVFYFRLWKPASGRSGLVTPQQIVQSAHLEVSSLVTLDDVTDLIRLKLKSANLEIFTYYRVILRESGSGVTCFPVHVDFELTVIDAILTLYHDLQALFPTSVEHDEELLRAGLPAPRKYAVVYRLSQKRILAAQIRYIEELRTILLKLQSHIPLHKHLVGTDLEHLKVVYPLREYLKSLHSSLTAHK